MFTGLVLLAFCALYYVTWMTRLRLDVALALPTAVERDILNMHYSTQGIAVYQDTLKVIFDDKEVEDRVFKRDIIPYAKRLWIALGDKRELTFDLAARTIAVRSGDFVKEEEFGAPSHVTPQ